MRCTIVILYIDGDIMTTKSITEYEIDAWEMTNNNSHESKLQRLFPSLR